MCLSDIVLPWMTQSYSGILTVVDGSPVQVVPADPWRIALRLGSNDANNGTWWTTGKGPGYPADGFGLAGGTFIPHLSFTAKNDGSLSANSWWAVCNTNPTKLYWAASGVAERYRPVMLEAIEKTLKGGAAAFLAGFTTPDAAAGVPGSNPGMKPWPKR